MKKCLKCEIEKVENEFNRDSTRKDGYENYCRECSHIMHKKTYDTRKEICIKENNGEIEVEESEINRKLFAYRCKEIKKRSKRENIPFNLTPEYLESLWTGKCALTKKDIFFRKRYSGNKKVPNLSADVDRIDPNGGYVQGNVQWVSHRINMVKSNSDMEDVRMIRDFLRKRNESEQQ